MSLKVVHTPLDGLLIIEPSVFADKRGFFMETYHQDKYSRYGINSNFVQDNYSFSTRGILRGMHYQLKHAQAKIVSAIHGEVFDVAVDIRRGSPTFGKWYGVYLSSENKRQLFIPEGFAHGFCVLSETAGFLYKCSDFYNPADEYGVIWSDKDIAIEWPAKNPVISEKDTKYSKLSAVDSSFLPVYKGKGAH